MGVPLEASVSASPLLRIQNEDPIVPLANAVQHLFIAAVSELYLVLPQGADNTLPLLIVADNNNRLLLVEFAEVLLNGLYHPLLGRELTDRWVHDR